VTHRSQAGRFHPVEPSRQTVSGWATGAKAPCTTHCDRRKDGSSPVTGRNPRRRNRRLHPVAVLPKARQAPEVEAKAGAGDRVQIGSLRHQVQPTARTVREGFSCITEVPGVAAV
jgi:hypothetical protein